MEQYLPPGEQYIRKALRFSLSSPFTFNGAHSAADIIKIYKDASDFAIRMISIGNTPTETVSAETNFRTILIENLGDDEQDKLIVLDYLIIDFVLENHNLSSS
jgi:hypothetical protein